jgi:molybdopterin synthase catalytic subunit
MRLKLKAFGALAEVLGWRENAVEVEDHTTVEEFRAYMMKAYPGAAPVLSHSVVAVGQRYAKPDAELSDGAEVALLPPVSGG